MSVEYFFYKCAGFLFFVFFFSAEEAIKSPGEKEEVR